MNNTTLDADRAEFEHLMTVAARGGLVPSTAQRLEVLRARLAAAERAQNTAEGHQAAMEITAAADALRATGHQ